MRKYILPSLIPVAPVATLRDRFSQLMLGEGSPMPLSQRCHINQKEANILVACVLWKTLGEGEGVRSGTEEIKIADRNFMLNKF